ncbi:type I-E CRISPR-associated protein Cse2/CasB [Candidatus Synechococcus calcipolaris G9]|uniref:Type I-E CRISPR-associated protein Cse2/CasB n=1 Tax=Candidatus Synechococcus calcipolaris G9 TaxID=1497997 RepID=A0ABT6F128_9SYNE|nr:type I-E CRISPR-associated protein Cse2/CasB [Candidatus Synechococcus calcipolaris]MDG2991566.1 type I-E CRISPR-associated protein Cse2/CasB [Candidatus Synechococcus calcipolaris G9]
MTKPSHKTIDQASRFLRAIQKELKIEFDENQQIINDIKQNKGARAALKNVLKGDTKHLIDTYSTVLKPLQDVGIDYQPEQPSDKGRLWIFVAGLFAHYPQPIEQKYRGNFGNSCWLLQQEIRRKNPDAKGIERRFHSLLDTDLGYLQSPLSALLRQMKAKDVVVNYPKLIADLHWWDRADKRVQDQWARAFWMTSSSDSSLETDNP